MRFFVLISLGFCSALPAQEGTQLHRIDAATGLSLLPALVTTGTERYAFDGDYVLAPTLRTAASDAKIGVSWASSEFRFENVFPEHSDLRLSLRTWADLRDYTFHDRGKGAIEDVLVARSQEERAYYQTLIRAGSSTLASLMSRMGVEGLTGDQLHSEGISAGGVYKISPVLSLLAEASLVFSSGASTTNEDSHAQAGLIFRINRWERLVVGAQWHSIGSTWMSDHRVIPMLGYVVRPSPELSFTAGFPRSEIRWQPDRWTALSAGLAYPYEVQIEATWMATPDFGVRFSGWHTTCNVSADTNQYVYRSTANSWVSWPNPRGEIGTEQNLYLRSAAMSLHGLWHSKDWNLDAGVGPAWMLVEVWHVGHQREGATRLEGILGAGPAISAMLRLRF